MPFLITRIWSTPHLTVNPKKPLRHHSLCIALIARFDVLGDIADLESAISYYEKALSITPNGYPHKSALLHILSTALVKRFQRLDDVADIHRSVSTIEEAVRITMAEHPNRAALLIDFGNSLCSLPKAQRYQRFKFGRCLHQTSRIHRT